MPFFGSKHKDNHHSVDERRHEPGLGHQHLDHDKTGSTVGTGAQGTNTYDNTGGTGTYPGAQDPNFGPSPHVPTGGTGLGPGNTTSSGVHYHDDNNYNRSTGRPTGGPTAAKLTGKVESVLGSAVGSNTLKAKGREKERAANIANMQGLNALELAEAERLEREALMHRQRVVGHAYHQDHGAHLANSNHAPGQFNSGIGPMQPGGYHK